MEPPPRPGERLRATKQVAPGEEHAPRWVAQAYCKEPATLGGRKFDLRLYLLVTASDPPRAYLCREGLARFATVPYAPPTERNAREVCMHVTNYTLNKREAGFVAAARGDEHGAGADKRSVTATFAELATRRAVAAARRGQRQRQIPLLIIQNLILALEHDQQPTSHESRVASHGP